MVLCPGKDAKATAQKAANLVKMGTVSDLFVCGLFCAGKDAKATAQKAAKAVKKGTFKKERKPRYTVTFHRPKTLKRTRTPKYPKQRYVFQYCLCTRRAVLQGSWLTLGRREGRLHVHL